MITLWHQNSHDETLNAKDKKNKKKLRNLFIYSKLYFEAASDLTGIYIYVCKNFKPYIILF
jgi:hypothetical protein